MKRIMRKHAKTVEEPDVVVLSEEEKRFVKEALVVNETGGYKYPAGLYDLLLIYTGIRVGEALSLRFRDYNSDLGIL